MSDIANPHDRLFKEVLTHMSAAQDVARNYLPQTIVQRLNLDSMELVKDSWVDPELREHFADVLYKLQWLNPENPGKLYLYILFEHKSQPDEDTAFQLLRYMTRQWQTHLEAESLPLPFIIPLVMYHGEANWKFPQTFEGMFGKIPDDMLPYVPRFAYELLDLSLGSSREIVGSPLVRSVFSLMHSIFATNLNDRMPEILKTLATGTPAEVRFLETMLRYAVNSGSIGESELAASFPEQVSTLMPTLAETWMERGKQEGIEMGKQEGRAEERLLLITRQLARKFGDAFEPALKSQLDQLSSRDLDQLADELLDFKTVVELHEWLANR